MWSRWFATGGLSWQAEYACRLERRPLADWQAALLPAGPARLVDVVAGPVSSLGSHVLGRDMEIIAVDPLADIYDELAAGIDRPPRTRLAFGEDLSARFAPDSFNLIACTNALDHSIALAWCVIEMLMVAHTGGRIVLMHRIDEAAGEAYATFHQWNPRTDETGHLIVWKREHRLDLS